MKRGQGRMRAGGGRGDGALTTGGPRTQLLVLAGVLLLLIAAYAAVLNALRPKTPGQEIGLGELRRLARQEQVGEVQILREDLRVVAATENGPVWAGLLGEMQATSLALDLAERDVAVTINTQSTKSLLALATQFALPAATIIVGFAFLYVLFQGLSRGELALLGRSRARRYSSEGQPDVTFADVAGQEEAVEELREVTAFLTAPDSFVAMGAAPPRGVLLLGPPGCGKTLLARAVAGEARVPFFSIAATEFVEMLVGVGPARVRSLFEQARAAAPAIVFIDEIDAIGRARSSGHSFNVEWEASLNELLVQLDGFDTASRVVLMAATNRADILDSALIRKGRFDRHVVVDLPDLTGRKAIFAVHSRSKRVAPEVNTDSLAHRTAGFSGADIASVMNEAALLAARRKSQVIAARDVDAAIERVLAGPERRSRVLGDEEKLRIAYHEAGHALVGWVLAPSITIDKVSIIARGATLGGMWHLPTQERHLRTRSQFEEQLAIDLAGRASEVVVYGDPSEASRDDLRRATRLAREMVCELGMSDAIGPAVVEGRVASDDGRVEAEQSAVVAAEIRRLLTEADARCREVLIESRPILDALADQLVKLETLDRADVERILASRDRSGPAVVAVQS